MSPSSSQASFNRPKCNDADLALQSAGRGDREAFAEFYDATSAQVFGLVLKMLRDEALSERVMQESYVEIWQHAPSFNRARGSATAWVLVLAYRQVKERRHATR